MLFNKSCEVKFKNIENLLTKIRNKKCLLIDQAVQWIFHWFIYVSM